MENETNTEKQSARPTGHGLAGAPGSAFVATEKWGIVFHDEKQVWQIIAVDGHILIDDIGEFRYPDTNTERKALRTLAEQIRDQHNYSLMKLSRPN